MTYHGGGEGQLSAAVVGFDYQRTMVAAAAALLGLFTAPPQRQQVTPNPNPSFALTLTLTLALA